MSNPQEILTGVIVGACALGCWYFSLSGIIGCYQAAKYRKPGRSFFFSMGLGPVMFSRDRYTEEAEPARRRVVMGCFGGVICCLVAFIAVLVIACC